MKRQELTHLTASRLTRLLGYMLAVTMTSLAGQGCTTAAQQTEFASPELATTSFVTALRADDRDGLRQMFGAGGQDLLFSGDAVSDQQSRQKFLAAYEQKSQVIRAADGKSATLVVGAQEWPLPIPLVKDRDSRKWRFDTAAGSDEIINRRIGRNELDVIEVCKAIVDAQLEYARRAPEGLGKAYAQKFMSDPGARNGLYWDTASTDMPSPLGPLVAQAVEEGYSSSATTQPRPYHGYCYRMLKSQGPNAPDGAFDYLVNGRMIGGFGLIAYPAEYGNSGIMTFMVNYKGIVYQKDLGPETAHIARGISAFDPGPGWQPAEPAAMAQSGSTAR